MLDIGFWELVIIGIVALLVIGPERLPGVASTLGRWVGRGRIFLSNVKADIDREVRLKELQDSMKLSESNALYDIVEETKEALKPEGMDENETLSVQEKTRAKAPDSATAKPQAPPEPSAPEKTAAAVPHDNKPDTPASTPSQHTP